MADLKPVSLWNRGRHRFETLLDQFAIVHAKLERVIVLASPPPLRPSPAFMLVLVEARGPNGPTTCGGVGKTMHDGRIEVQIMGQQVLADCRVTVFCDLERVEIHGIFIGVDLVTSQLGSCPVAFFKDWVPGQKLIVQGLDRGRPAT